MAESIIRLEIEVKGRLDLAKAKLQKKEGKHFTHSEFFDKVLNTYEEVEKIGLEIEELEAKR